MDQPDKLDLVELVDPVESPHIPPVRARFAPETGGVRAEPDRQLLLREYLVPVVIGHRDLGGRHHEQPVTGYDIHLVLFVRQLTRPGDARRVHHQRRAHFRVTPAAGFVEEEIDERPFELRAPADVHGKPRTGDLGSPREIDDPELLHQLPVRFERKIGRRFFPPGRHGLVVRGGPARGYARMGHVGDEEERRMEVLLDGGEGSVECPDFLRHGAHFQDERGGVFSL